MQKHNTIESYDYIAIISLPITYYNIKFPIYERNPSNPTINNTKASSSPKISLCHILIRAHSITTLPIGG